MFQFKLKQTERQILHVDADAFFASVEQVLNPKLKGKPVLVGGPSEDHGIVSAASYEAKKYGINSGMPMYQAKRKCPQGIVVKANFDAYRDFSRRMMKIFTNYTLRVEMASIDEAYLDITGYDRFFDKPPHVLAKEILMEINKELGISVSCGLATNKTVAKVASSTNKPHKLTVVPFGKEARFLAPLSLRALPGVGSKTFSVLESRGFSKVGEYAALSIDDVLNLFGVQGIPIWKKCFGIDNSEVVANSSLPKSISKENTFYDDVFDRESCLKALKQLSAKVFSKLRRHEMKARTVFLKIRYKSMKEDFSGRHGFQDFSFQRHLGIYTCADDELFKHIKKLFDENFTEGEPIRLLGVGVTNLLQNYNLDLFEKNTNMDQLFVTMDNLKKLYGEETIGYGV